MRVEWGQGESEVSRLFRSIRKTDKDELRVKTKHSNDTVSLGTVPLRRVIIPWDAYNQVLIDVYQYSEVAHLLLQCPKQKTS